MSMVDIETMAKTHAQARQVLCERMQQLEDLLRRTRRQRIAGIKSAVARVTDTGDALKAFVSSHAALFSRPKTRTFHGVRIGLQRQKTKIEWDDEDKVVELIRKHLPDQAETLVKTTHKPIRKALANLPAKDLRKIGARLTPAKDEVLIKSTDTEIDKMVDALLAEGDEPMTEEAAA